MSTPTHIKCDVCGDLVSLAKEDYVPSPHDPTKMHAPIIELYGPEFNYRRAFVCQKHWKEYLG
jgi:hypothetical protein